MSHPLPEGFRLFENHLSREEQAKVLADVRGIVAAAPLFSPVMPRSGRPFSVRMSAAGPLGWVSDKSGYRYQKTHPLTGEAWPRIPGSIRRIWDDLSGYREEPECCLVNFYEPDARMGLHRDEDEEELEAPVVSISLGDSGLFRIGGKKRNDRTRSLRLHSGDVLVMGGDARLNFHGIDRIYPGTSTLLKVPGRINLTLRRVSIPV